MTVATFLGLAIVSASRYIYAILPLRCDMKKLRVLYFEDDHHDAKLAQHAMRRAGLDIDWLVVSQVDDYCSALVRGGLDLILSDNGIIGFSGKAALEAARTQCPQVPFIVVSGSDDPK